MNNCILVMGPAGSGKSSFSSSLSQLNYSIINLDPAIPNPNAAVDITDLVNSTDVMLSLSLGPNGSLLFCLEYLLDNIDEFIQSLPDSNIIIDCPGQIELFVHSNILPNIIQAIQQSYNTIAVHLIDSTNISDNHKLIASSLSALSSMLLFNLPHINILSKSDLVNKKSLNSFLNNSFEQISPKNNLDNALLSLLSQFNLVSFIPFSIHSQSDPKHILSYINHILQSDEHQEPKEPKVNGLDNLQVNLEDEIVE